MTTSSYPRVFPAPTPISLSVKSRSGNIQVTAADVTETTVDIQPGKPGDTDAIEVIDRARVDHQENALRIDISRRGKGPSLLRDPSVNVRVTVPLSSAVSVQAGSADVVLTGGLGDVAAKTGSGDVIAESCADVTIKTGSGDIRVDGATGAEANTGSGDILVQHCSGRIGTDTGSGNIRIDRAGDHTEAHTSSGDIEVGEVMAQLDSRTASGDIRIRRAIEGDVAAKTASGDVTVGVATGTAAKLDCSSASGRVRSDLEPADAPAETDRTVLIAARAASGSITIARAS
ncbi:DUF4097 family beta strand repeat-containing protein [Phytoactinopolyspora endophytica]|uniref:DUF4097 family beta strand repeat-containing protein n=1 Tax=Phytoactinopolyspora endophytica TaxID=1642495 RepID=UPI0013EE19D2|nr:DUF4097 family beta strand repeat-containing protein [Phytoactinopolyspora endophytica]